jgi:hypothetical protein
MAQARVGRARRARRVGGILTSSSPSSAEDFFCKTAMSRREDNVSCVDVAILDRFAHSALPSPYSKIFPAFWAGAAVTRAAGLGGKRFIDLRKPHACVGAFIQQHGSKRAPARIEHRLGQSGLSERRGIYVADEDSTVGLHQTGALQGAVTARDRFEERPEVESRQKPPLALEHFDRQVIAIIEYGVDLSRQTSIPKTQSITPWQTSRNAGGGGHARSRVSLSFAGLKASVSRGEMG